jgi:hypothetical protein
MHVAVQGCGAGEVCSPYVRPQHDRVDGSELEPDDGL